MRRNVNRRVITSIDEFIEASQAAGVVPFLLRPGLMRVELIRANLGPLVAEVVHCSFPLAFQGETVADRIWMVVPMNRTSGEHLNGEPLTTGDLLAFGGSVEVAGASGALLQCGMLSITSDAFERTATAFGVELHAPGEGEFRVVRLVDGARLRRAFDFLSYSVHHQNDVALTRREAGAVQRAFLEVAARSLAADSSGSPPFLSTRLKSAKIARACEDYARRSRYHNVTLADLCTASGLSERRVRSAFYHSYQMSPTAFLRVTALNAVRRELVAGPRLRDAVSHVAAEWGFWHLSRFAASLLCASVSLPYQSGRLRVGAG